MAVTYTKQPLGTTLNRLVYLVKSAGAENGTLANATMVADGTIGGTVGKLAQLIRDTVVDGGGGGDDPKAIALFYNHPQIRTSIYAPNWGVSIDTAQWKFTFRDDGATNRSEINGATVAADATGVLLVIEYRPSLGR